MVGFAKNQIDKDDKLLKGLKDRGLINFECADCGEILLVLQLTGIDGDNNGEVITRVAVKCRQCGGFSYVKQIPGQFHPGAPSDNISFDVLDNDIDAPEADVLFEAWKK